MEISKIDSVLIHLSKQNNIYVTAKQIDKQLDVSLDDIIDILELLEEEKYIRREDHIPSDYTSDDVLRYWKITIKGKLLNSNKGYKGLQRNLTIERFLKGSLLAVSLIVGSYSLIRLLADFLIPWFSCC